MAKQPKNQDIQGSKPAPLGGQPGYGGITEGNVGADIAGQPIPGGPDQNTPGYSGGDRAKSESADPPSLLEDREEGSMNAAQGSRDEGGQSIPSTTSSVNEGAHEQPLRQGESSGSREGGVAGSGGSIDRQQPLRQGESGKGVVANPSNPYTGVTPHHDESSKK